MRESKNPSIEPDPSPARVYTPTKRNIQLARVVKDGVSTEWLLLSTAATLAREKGGKVFTGYFDKKSKEVKHAT